MANQITILNSTTRPDGSFSISGVFWFVAPTNLIVPLPSFKSQVPNVSAADLSSLQSGALVEVPFHTGLYNSGTTLATIQSDLQAQYTADQDALNNSVPAIGKISGIAFDGTSWSTPTTPLNVPTQSVVLNGVPTTPDGRYNFAPNAFPVWASLYFVGRGDDPVNGIAKGTRFYLSSDGYGDTTTTWHYNDPIFVLGAIITYTGGQIGDTLDYMISADATPVGSGTQSVNLVNVGPGNIIVPVPSGGSTTVNVATAIPVPNVTNTGFWDVNQSQTGLGAISPNYNQTGGYDLYDFSVNLAHVAAEVPMVGDNQRLEIVIESVTSMELLPHWTHTGTIHNSGHTGLRVGWCFAAARAVSV